MGAEQAGTIKNAKTKNPRFSGVFGTLLELFGLKNGGAEEDRTPDLRIANATLSQLSYGPTRQRET